MAIILATKTSQAIAESMYADQGRAFKHFLRKHILDVDDAFDDGVHDKFRSHMGISQSGRECAREIWYSWRWATHVRFSGQQLRLFNRGHLEEARFTAMLRSIGIQIFQADENGKQFRISYFGGHYGSAIDGVGVGIPDFESDKPVLTEFKTHKEKSFRKLIGEVDKEGNVIKPPEGVKKSKVEHYVQMQQYMEYYKLEFALYGAVNKDTDEVYWEIVPFDPECAKYFRERSQRIIFAKEAPPKLSHNPSFWKCKYCDQKRVCHFDAAPEFNCRTCFAAQPHDDGTWWCSTHNAILDKERQLSGCPEYQMHPSLGVQK